jgi:hypothetical protein
MGFFKTLATKVQATGVAARAKGQAMVEYGLILVLVSVVAIVGLTVVGGQLYNPAMVSTDVVAGTSTVPVHFLKVGDTGYAGHVPGAFNNIVLSMSNGAQFK